jgi:hypothetical protein
MVESWSAIVVNGRPFSLMLASLAFPPAVSSMRPSQSQSQLLVRALMSNTCDSPCRSVNEKVGSGCREPAAKLSVLGGRRSRSVIRKRVWLGPLPRPPQDATRPRWGVRLCTRRMWKPVIATGSLPVSDTVTCTRLSSASIAPRCLAHRYRPKHVSIASGGVGSWVVLLNQYSPPTVVGPNEIWSTLVCTTSSTGNVAVALLSMRLVPNMMTAVAATPHPATKIATSLRHDRCTRLWFAPPLSFTSGIPARSRADDIVPSYVQTRRTNLVARGFGVACGS